MLAMFKASDVEALDAKVAEDTSDVSHATADSCSATELLLRQMTTTVESVKHIEDAEFLWNGVIVWQHYHVWCAPPNAGKTTIAWQAACDLAAAKRVVYVNFDANAADLKQFAIEAEASGITLVTNLSADDVRVHQLLAQLEQEDDLSNYVLFIDTLKKFCDVNDKRSRKLYAVIRGLTSKGFTVIALAHTTKREEADGKRTYDGVGDLEADCDELMMMEYIKDEKFNRQTVSCEFKKVRSMARPVTFSWDINDRVVEVEGNHVDLAAEAKFARMLSENEPLIREIQLLIAEQPLNQSKLLERAKEQEVTEREVRDLLESGVERFWHRHKGDKNAWIYAPLTNSPNTSNRIAD
jgi:hypothetical protein